MDKKKKNKSAVSVGSRVKRRSPQTKGSKVKEKRKPTREKSSDGKDKVVRKKRKHPILKKFIIITFLLLVLAILVGVGIFCGIFFSDKFALSREDLLLSNANTIIYDRDGNVIAELSGAENRKIISYDQMVKYLPDAFVAIEDERFYQHKGVDIKRTLAATTTFMTKGDSSFGGSTITQQLIKNITNERDNSGSAGVERKIKEMSRAYQVEKMITKKQILELYLNIIPLGADGGDICGVEMASMYYFNKSAADLTVEECAFLAGINNAPNTYNPFKNSDDAEKQAQVMAKIKTRTQTVLKKMKELGFINDEEYNTAYQNAENGLAFSKGNLPSSTIKDYFIEAAVDNVVKDLVEKKGMSVEYAKNRVYGGGYRIYTTEVASIQKSAYDVYTSGQYILTTSLETNHSQSAIVIIDHTKGHVVGCMGGLGNDVDAIGINRATDAIRQSGSSIKPIVTYGFGVESGIINPATIYNDEQIYFGNWTPHNDNRQFSGFITVRNAIERSVNVVACKIMAELGPDNAIDFARKCGITTLKKSSEVEYGKNNDSNISAMALGGQTDGVRVIEMAAAYAMIANNGVYISPTFYTKVEDSSGNIVIEAEQKQERVMSEQHAYIMKSLLKNPVEGAGGTAKVCRMNNFDVGAKTGTTNEKRDNWLCGMTPYYTAAAWYGYDRRSPINGSGNNAAKLWSDVMKKVHADLPAATFAMPEGITKANVCRKTGLRASSTCSDVYSEFFVESELPEQCEGHSMKVCSESGKIATEFCPEVYDYSYLPIKEQNPLWKSNGGNYAAPTETCSIHTSNNNGGNTGNEDNPGINITTTDVKVPNVYGLSEAEATKKLQGLSLDVKTKYKSDESKENGIVLSQSIPADSLVEKNARIVITINKIEKPNPDDNKPNPDDNKPNPDDNKPNPDDNKPNPDDTNTP